MECEKESAVFYQCWTGVLGSNMKKLVKYSLRFVGWLLLLLLVLLVLAGLLIQTKPVKQKLAKVASQQVSEMLNGQLKIGSIGGNFFNSLELKNVLLTHQQDTLAFIPVIEARYNLWPLVYGHLEVHVVQLTQPYLHLEQVNDSTWNLQQLMKPSPGQTDTSSSTKFSVDLSQFQIKEGWLKIDSPDSLIPQGVQHINTTLSMNYSGNRQALRLSHFSLDTKSPDLQLKQLAFTVHRELGKIHLSDFILQTQQNKLRGKASFADDPFLHASAQFKSDSLYLDEFAYFMSGFEIPAHPVLTLNGTMLKDSLEASVDLKDQQQSFQLNLSSDNLAGFIQNNPSDSLLRYRLSSTLKNIVLSHWLSEPTLNYLVNGKFKINGQGFDPKTARISADGNFKDCVIEEKPVDDLQFTMNLKNGTLDGEARGKGDFGSFWLKPQLKNLQTTPVYQAELKTEKLDLAQLTGNDSLKSDINLQANLKGEGFDPKSLSAHGTIQLSKSKISQLNLDSLLARINFRNENLVIDSMMARTPNSHLQVNGNYSLKSSSDLRFLASFDNINDLQSYFPVSDLKTSGSLIGRLWGVPDSLNLQSSLKLDETQYVDYNLNRSQVKVDGKLTKKDTVFHAHGLAKQFQSSVLNLDSLAFSMDYQTDSIFITGQLANQDLQSQLQARLHLGDTMRLTLPEWNVDYKSQHWKLAQSPAVLEFDSLSYRISHFKMASDDSDTAQFISAAGQLSQKGENNLKLKAANINLNQLAGMFQPDIPASGSFSMNLALNGQADSTTLDGDFNIDKANFNGYSFSDFGGSFHTQDNRLALQSQIIPQDSGRVELSGSIPIELAMDSLQFNMNPKDSLDLKLIVSKFPLAVLQTFNLTDEIKGFINGDIAVKGTLESPDPIGNLRMKDGIVKVDRYGIDYRDIRFSMNFLRDKMQLDTFGIKTTDGDLTADGQVDFSSDFYKGNISQSQINLKFHHFNPVDHPRFNMEVDGDVNMGGKKDSVKFDGDLTVPQSEFYLPAIYNLMGKVESPEIPKPMLVQAMEEQAAPKIPSVADSSQTVAIDSVDWSYFDHLTGKIKLHIPRNTWIKDEDMHIEISGDLEMIKHPSFFELFGTMDVVRGQYDLFGRTFIINEGTITFEGGEEMMPRVNINASYTFRNTDQVQQTLDVTITGTAEEPSVKFTVDGSSVSEGDALSYILFGKSMNELSMDQQESVSGVGNLAGKAAASLLSSQLTSYLGQKLNVDYIEVKGSGDFNNASVVVGKYITNNLFVSYEQRFGETDQKNMAKYEVKLEYELFRSLFFQLSNSSTDSGFDVVFKFNSK